MKVILFGATGMVGQGVLRECLLDARITQVTTVGRNATGTQHSKLRELVHGDLYEYTAIEHALTGFDACFFCLGVSSAGMSEAAYSKVTFELTLAAARVLLKLNPELRFLFISGAGTDSTERGRSMWARVKGKTENALLAMPFGAAFMFRPGLIQPLHGITSRTTSYRILYVVMAPFLPLLRAVAPSLVTTTERLGRALIEVAEKGYEKRILESIDINEVAASR